MTETTLVWFRSDLRLADNPALAAAVKKGGPVVPIFIWAPDEEGDWRPGAASEWWLHRSLSQLDESLRERASRLIVRTGPTLKTLQELVEQTGATTVYWNRRYEPAIVERDRAVKTALRQTGRIAKSFNGALLFEPWQVATREGAPFKVFSPFWNACLAQPEPEHPTPAPFVLRHPRRWPETLAIDELGLEPVLDWAGGLGTSWNPGEAAARDRLDRFLDEALADYRAGRDRPGQAGTSRMSPHLHFGEISPRQVWSEVHRRLHGRGEASEHFLRELGWREFAHHLLFHFPHTPERPLREQFSMFPWSQNRQHLILWRRGRTGYPIVDAGMRELLRTGWMHNRVRMIAASFLVKDLLQPWRQGAEWFWDTLVDADLANNTLGWQWTAGCGADAAPYFRIFNPVSQGEKFDPEGEYVRRWVPELARLPNDWIHQPWNAPAHILAEAKVELGITYPEPVVDHHEARLRALEAFGQIRGVKG